MLRKTLLILFVALPVFAINLPVLFQCTYLKIEQNRNGEIYRKGFMVNSLYLKISRTDILVWGKQSGKSVCRKIGIKRIYMDTLYLSVSEKQVQGELKLYLNGDTLKGNFNVLDNSAENGTVCLLVKRVGSEKDSEMKKSCFQ
jgi:hypothetical protein